MRYRLTAKTLVRAAAFMLCLLAPAARAADCFMRCADAKGCTVQQVLALSYQSYVHVARCETRVCGSGEVELRYRRGGKPFTAPQTVKVGEAFATVFEKYPADLCGVGRNCLQEEMNTRVSRPGGHGADSVEGKPGGEGEPCARGLPCSRVVPPPARWVIQLADTAFNGSWHVTPARNVQGSPSAALTAAVSAGRIDADGAWFRPGSQYSYELLDAKVAVAAKGEFSTLSQKMADDLRDRIEVRVREGTPPAVARFDVLTRNALDWDAQQLIVQGRQ